jgi:hypothetical protein
MLLMSPIEVTEEQLRSVVQSVAPFTITLTPPGIVLHQLVTAVARGGPLYICETGCLRDPTPTGMMADGWSSFYFAKWANDNPGSKLTTIDLNAINLEYCRLYLSGFDFKSEFHELINKDSVIAIQELKEHPDVFYLDSCDDLDHGLAEFEAALAHNPKLIIMDDLVSKAAKAVEFAKTLGISCQYLGRYTLFFIERKTANV